MKNADRREADCVYNCSDHGCPLCPDLMLCLEHKVPVLCEKAMFVNSAQAETVFEKARQEKVFVMEAMWSRFLPAIKMAKQ